MRTIATISKPSKSISAKVKYEATSKEYVVQFYRNGAHLTQADYFTDDRQDAIDTANYTVDNS
jgi:hypothetical protein